MTELGGVAVEIPKDEWHSVTIELSGADGSHVVVKHRLHDASEPQTIEADTTILGDGDLGFGVGEKAHFRFDNAGTDVVVDPGVALRYHYDASGRVVGRTLDPDGANLSQFFIYDEDRIVQELDGEGHLVAEWVYGDYIDELFAMYRDTDANGSLESTYYYIQDDLYNVVALTDDDGEVVERYSYDDYGMPTVWVEDDQNPGTWIEHTDASGAPVSSVGNVFMFTGRRWDPELGLYDFRTRYYNPKLGRFLRVDTIGPWGDPANLGNPYTYLGNNPWSATDPWGEAKEDAPFELVVALQAALEQTFAEAVAAPTPQLEGQIRHTILQRNVEGIGSVLLLSEKAVDAKGFVLPFRSSGSLAPDVIMVVLKEGEDAQDFLSGSKSLFGRVDAVLDLKTGARGIRKSWAKSVATRLGIRACDIIEVRQGLNLVQQFGLAKGLRTMGLAKELTKKTGGTAAKMVPIAGALLAYKAARAQGWDPELAMAYAGASVLDLDLAVDAALLAHSAFLKTAELYSKGYEDQYVGYLEEAIEKSSQLNAHEEGYDQRRLDMMGESGTPRAGDVRVYLGK